VGPGQTIGEISLFDPAPSTATVIATEFSQLWRIADEDLLQFMEEDPGAGNILLRTLTKILTQRLRQIDPAAFGLSAYAVVQSPELEAQDAATSQRIPNVTAALSSPAPASAIPLPAVEFPKPAPAESPAPASAAPGTITPPLPSRVVVAAQAPEEPSSRKKTQPFADPDELEPL
jgi:CRP-like cAMP-binding protein